MASDRQAYTFDLTIAVGHFQTSDRWRAGTQIAGTTIISQAERDPVAAVQALCLKIGSGHENADIAIESALNGGNFFGMLGDGKNAAEPA